MAKISKVKAEAMSKYDPLKDYLIKSQERAIRLVSLRLKES